MFRMDDKVEVTGINEAIRAMRSIDKEAVKALRTDLKQKINPVAQKIAAQVQTNAPLSGMNHTARTGWRGARGTTSFAPAKIRKGADMHPIVSVKLTGRGSSAGFDIAEIAGSRGLAFSKNRRKGAKFVANLQKRAPFRTKAGRFGFGYFLREKPTIQKAAIEILEKHAKEFEKKIKRAS